MEGGSIAVLLEGGSIAVLLEGGSIAVLFESGSIAVLLEGGSIAALLVLFILPCCESTRQSMCRCVSFQPDILSDRPLIGL